MAKNNSKSKEPRKKAREKVKKDNKSSSGSGCSTNNKNNNKTSAASWRFMPKTKCGYCICILLTIIVTCLILVLTIYSNYLTFVAKQNRNISDILNEIVQYANELETLELQYKRVLMTDPFQELVENQVMPVHDKMSSIKRQLKIYEDMNHRMPGGPTNFMESSFKDINFIEDKIHEFERQYGLILVSMKKELEALSAESRKIYTKLMGVIDEDTLKKLRDKNIYLDDDSNSKSRYKLTKTFEQVIELISQLANIFAQWEVPKEELYRLIRENNITEIEQTEGTPAFALYEVMRIFQQIIDDFLEENSKYIRLTFMFFEQQLDGFRKAEEEIVFVQTKFKMRYDRLTEMLTDDIFNARERVKNLRYSSNKKEL